MIIEYLNYLNAGYKNYFSVHTYLPVYVVKILYWPQSRKTVTIIRRSPVPVMAGTSLFVQRTPVKGVHDVKTIHFQPRAGQEARRVF